MMFKKKQKLKTDPEMEIFPSNAIKTIQTKKRIYLIVNARLVLKRDIFLSTDYLDLIDRYEKQHWKFHSVVASYIYFYKKKSFYKRFIKWIK